MPRRPGPHARGTSAPGARARGRRHADDGPALLIRPDGYITWAGSNTADHAWRNALHEWTGHSA
ncbi:hypothetical protein ACIRRA_38520 [Nocardia sp. NPDC101769]|uniref:aromatic-ring hydroxylase C-terminal domain-containing protein n=1 Tax=Nocardia sp. NPDC101769 TaxID=3364333 RepID=UPI0037F67F34